MSTKEVLPKSSYEQWIESEHLPIIRGYSVDDLRTLSLEPWERKGAKGAFINLEGTSEINDAYVCEIPPGGSLKIQKHMFEELIFILNGQGATTIWSEGEAKQTFEWQEGSLFSPPLNTYYQHFNGQGDKPARFIAVSSAPTVINLFHNLDFIFKNGFIFRDRFNSQQNFFTSQGKFLKNNVWETNFIPDVTKFTLTDNKQRGAGGRSIRFEMSDSTMAPHMSEFPPGTYKKAHRHGPGAHIIVLSGKGYSLIWPEGSSRIKVDWHKGSLFVPPNMWFHQHFNTGNEPARYLALKLGGSRKYIYNIDNYGADEDLKRGGKQIEYHDEDPAIRVLYETELAKEGLKIDETRMPRMNKR